MTSVSAMTLMYLVGAVHKRSVNKRRELVKEFATQNLLVKIHQNDIVPKQSDGTFHNWIILN